jgi:hypothetical protein
VLLLKLFNFFTFYSMGIGLSGTTTTQKREITGPFPAGVAANGDSVDASGVIVLGNDVGDVLAPARLLNNREIITSPVLPALPFFVSFNDSTFLCETQLTGTNILMLAGAGGQPIFEQRVNNGVQNEIFQIIGTGSGTTDIGVGTPGPGTITVISLQHSSTFMQLGTPIQGTFNGAHVQINGSMTHQASLNGQTGAYNVDRDLDSARVLFNSGAATYTLPNMTGANDRPGFTVRAAVVNAAGIVIQASAGQTMRFGAAASSVAGTLTSVTVGSTIRLVLVNSTTWFTESFTGTWVPA